MAKLSSPYKFQGKIFRYDFQNSMVQYLYKASAEEIEEERKRRRKRSPQKPVKTGNKH